MSCIICLERDSQIVLNPCGHTYCEPCSLQLNKCGICRSSITDRIKFYLNNLQPSNKPTLSKEALDSFSDVQKQIKIYNNLLIEKEDEFQLKYNFILTKIESKTHTIIKEAKDKKESLINNLNEINKNSNDAMNRFKEKKLDIENQLNEIQTQITNQNK